MLLSIIYTYKKPILKKTKVCGELCYVVFTFAIIVGVNGYVTKTWLWHSHFILCINLYGKLLYMFYAIIIIKHLFPYIVNYQWKEKERTS